MANFKILIKSSKYLPEQIKSAIKKPEVWDSSWKIEEPETGIRTRGITDPAILVAVVGAAGTAIGALIAGLFQLVNVRKDAEIQLTWSDGTSIKFPANLSPEELDEKIHKLRPLEAKTYEILLP